MSKKVQRQYSDELKLSAVKMVLEELKTLTQVSEALKTPLQTLHSWVTKGRKGGYLIYPKSSHTANSTHIKVPSTYQIDKNITFKIKESLIFYV